MHGAKTAIDIVAHKHCHGMLEGRSFDIGLDALGHLPQQVVTTVDIADTVDPHAIRDATLARSWSRRFPEPLPERTHPRHEFSRRLGPMLSRAHAPWPPAQGSLPKPLLVPVFSAPAARVAYAAGRSAERCSATGISVPIIVSKTRTRPAESSRSSVPTKSANGPDRIRTVCPVVRPASKSVKLASSVRAMRASTTPWGTGTGRSSQVNREETPTVLRTDSQRSRSGSRIKNM